MAREKKAVVPQPMLAGSITDRNDIQFPVYASEKLDGIRAIVKDGKVCSRREWKVLPNKFVQEAFGRPEYEGFDGELCLTKFEKNIFSETQSIVTSDEKPLGDVKFFVFDIFGDDRPYIKRYLDLDFRQARGKFPENVKLVDHVWCDNLDELEAFEQTIINKPGYEGFMINDPQASYLFGRAKGKTHADKRGPRSIELMKVKPFNDAEAVIVGFKQLISNKGEIRQDGFGNNYRHVDLERREEALFPQEMVGAFYAVFHNGTEEIKFKIGSGLTKELREHAWKNQDEFLGKIVKFRYNDLAGQGRPRNPRFIALRDIIDVLDATLHNADEILARWKHVEVQDEE